jgi:ABC-type Co2+ transport system permease subunit
MLDISELIKRAIKYLVMGFMISLVCFAIPKRSLNLEEIGAISLTAAATFAILDTYLPSISASARQGAGLGIGLGVVGGLPILGL